MDFSKNLAKLKLLKDKALDIAADISSKALDTSQDALTLVNNSEKEEKKPILSTETLISLVQGIVKKVSPVNIDITGSVNEKKIVIDEKDLNLYLNEKLKDQDEIKNLNLTIFDDNIVKIDFDVKKVISLHVSQTMRIDEFVINEKSGYVKLSVIDPFNFEAKEFTNKVILFFTKFIIKSIFKTKLNDLAQENNIILSEDKIEIDLSKGFLEKYYSLTLLEVMESSDTTLPDLGLIGSVAKIAINQLAKRLKVLSLINIDKMITKKGKLIIDFVVKLPKPSDL